ncbi:hypothetical protein CROQUDRAFT_109253 [Cronartium quercuum f. sp. fusiforme G11]|uniref:Uncharacterized protein n=1 Tax=Cronartium quercuum f. sp. fusiforme G11 TaxID=708437 RepID=A0A9P6T8U1_9BASI|nr:hypothetical protein CROQUDRAFT_109253 [Cronartium quercuum f. sp. fusiforme G11]
MATARPLHAASEFNEFITAGSVSAISIYFHLGHRVMHLKDVFGDALRPECRVLAGMKNFYEKHQGMFEVGVLLGHIYRPSQTFCREFWRRVILSPSPLLRNPSTSLSTPRPRLSLTTSFPSIHLNLSIDDSTHEPLSTSLQN